MLALSPPLFPSFGWPLEDYSISHEHNNNFFRETEISDQSFLLSPPPALSQPLAEVNGGFNYSNEVEGDDPTMAKKLNHNASERDRRKRINDLYSTLRSLLPASDRSKKLSIPATVSRALKYIPELQREVEKLVQNKEELISTINNSKQLEDSVHRLRNPRKRAMRPSLSVVSAIPLGDGEVLIQISTVKLKNQSGLLSEILLNLEEEGLLLLNVSCFESFGDRVFYNLHVEVQGAQGVEFEMLREKLLSSCERREHLF